jgi:5-(aminomethyl)-3-furanmethanol phosphate kinase
VSALSVVKLGGSLAYSKDLPAWLAAIGAGAGKTVLVVGGGPFADAVRQAQPRLGFDDVAADAMALLAMEQYAVAVASLGRSLAVAESYSRIRRALEAGEVPVWAPSRMVQQARRLAASSSSREGVDIPASWDVTSDSLAVWLAHKLRARRLFLIKQVLVEAQGSADHSVTAEHLARTGVVDKAFPRSLAVASAVEGFLLGTNDREGLATALCEGTPIGSRIGLVAGAEPIHHAARPVEGVDGRVLPGDDHA